MISNRLLLAGKVLSLLSAVNATTLIDRTSAVNHRALFEAESHPLLQAPILANVPASGYCFTADSTKKFRCAGTTTCTADYQQCQYIDQVACTDASKPFRCFSTGIQCAANMATDCCPAGSFFCPHLRKCVTAASDCCSLNSATPIFCSATNSCVSHAY